MGFNEEKLEYIFKLANNNDAKAQYYLAICYFEGNRVEQSLDESTKWFKKASENWYGPAQYNLGINYLKGWGVEKNEEKAVFWLKKSAEKDIEPAIVELAKCYLNGIGIEQNYDKAVYYFESIILNNDGFVDPTISELEAIYYLGMCHKNGTGKDVDKTLAFEFFEVAAEYGYMDAMYELANCYLNGEGTEKNIQSALEMYASLLFNNYFKFLTNPVQTLIKLDINKIVKTPMDGDIEKLYYLAECYYHGIGVENDFKKALSYYINSGYRGYDKAQYALGNFYINDKGIDKDPRIAKYWYEKASDNGYLPAKLTLAMLYYLGVGTDEDESLAVSMLKEVKEKLKDNENYDEDMLMRLTNITNNILNIIEMDKEKTKN